MYGVGTGQFSHISSLGIRPLGAAGAASGRAAFCSYDDGYSAAERRRDGHHEGCRVCRVCARGQGGWRGRSRRQRAAKHPLATSHTQQHAQIQRRAAAGDAACPAATPPLAQILGTEAVAFQIYVHLFLCSTLALPTTDTSEHGSFLYCEAALICWLLVLHNRRMPSWRS